MPGVTFAPDPNGVADAHDAWAGLRRVIVADRADRRLSRRGIAENGVVVERRHDFRLLRIGFSIYFCAVIFAIRPFASNHSTWKRTLPLGSMNDPGTPGVAGIKPRKIGLSLPPTLAIRLMKTYGWGRP